MKVEINAEMHLNIISVIPPTSQSFPYWAFKQKRPNAKKTKMMFKHLEDVREVNIIDIEEEEVTQYGKIQREVPDLFSEYRTLTE